MGLRDGIPSLEVRTTDASGTTFQATTGSFTNLALGTSQIGNDELADNAGSGTKVSAEFPIGYIGSPVAGTLAFQCGSADASDVSVTVAFGIPFAGNPLVWVQPIESGTLASQSFVGSSTTTGFNFWGQSGIMHAWFAINNGRV